MRIDISGLDEASVLAALYNYACPQGVGIFQYDPSPMDIAEAKTLLAKTKKFDYINGRVLKVTFSGSSFDPYLYNRDNGEDAAENAIDSIRNENL